MKIALRGAIFRAFEPTLRMLRMINFFLVFRLMELEQEMATITDLKLKVIEEAGAKLRDVLCRSDPWENMPCERPACLTCSYEEGRAGDCRTRNVVYASTCLALQEGGQGGAVHRGDG